MEERQALLRAIIDDPDDDTVRLVYADWLDEHDEADRAEFIRVQIELAHLADDDPRRPELDKQSETLFDGMRLAQLRDEFPAECRSLPLSHHLFRRGFLTRVELDATMTGEPVPGSQNYGRSKGVDHFVRVAPVLFAHAPITELWLGPSIEVNWDSRQEWSYYLNSGMLLDLESVPELARLRSLELSCPAFDLDAVCHAVTANPHLRNLRRLHINNRYLQVPSAWPPDVWVEDALELATQLELRAAFGDRVSWDV